ncbi:MAG: 1-acyl-sn-glycerol-3-phosphate acyltransferase [Puniceicoccales bacterium]|nr:1-acyl-sn-glycerol-3-phosphate acyltransferase [Puniceicoccales bacterium]
MRRTPVNYRFDKINKNSLLATMLIHPVYRIVVFIAKIMFRELFDGDVYGDENIPRHGPCLLACNHLSYFDPPFIGSAVSNREVFSMARSSLFRTKFRNWLFRNMNCVALNRGGADVAAIRAALRLLKNGKCLMIFPEGTRSKDGSHGSVHAGVGMLACRTRVQVIPCRIFGTFEIMGRGRKFFDWNRKATIVFGTALKPADYMPPDAYKRDYEYSAAVIMEAVRSIQIPGCAK